MNSLLVRHPAKYSDVLLPFFYEEVKDCRNILDPFAGTGKIGKLKELGYSGGIYANDIEPDWLSPNTYGCDFLTYEDAEFLTYPNGFFEAVVTSPTYGNRMADHHNAKDGSKRITYTHCLGKPLQLGNTGVMHFGKNYCDKHQRIYSHLYNLIAPGGKIVVNVSNFIRKGVEVDVAGWTEQALIIAGFRFDNRINVDTPRMGYGANREKRVAYEKILIFRKE